MDEKINEEERKLTEAEKPELFRLSEVGSLYFGENPDPEAQQLLEQVRDLLRDDCRIQLEKTMIAEREENILKKKIFLASTAKVPSVDFEPITEVKRILKSARALTEEGGEIDHLKAKLQLDQTELRRRKLILQKVIRSYELEKSASLKLQ